MNNQGTPIYIQLADSIKNKIGEGVYKIGDKIPSEREMASTYEITRVTVRRAINSLIEEGVLTPVLGSGTYVSNIPENFKRINLGSGSSSRLILDISKEGMTPSRKVISKKYISVSDEMRPFFPNEEKLFELTRIMYINEIPYALQISCIPFSLFEDTNDKDFGTESLYDYMEIKGHRPVKIPSSISIVNIDKEYADILNCKPNKKVFYFTYIGYDSDNIVVEVTKSYNLPEHTEYKYTIKRF